MENQSTKLTYTVSGNYHIPKITFSVETTKNLGKYGRLQGADGGSCFDRTDI